MRRRSREAALSACARKRCVFATQARGKLPRTTGWQPVLPGKKPAPYSTLDVERWALDVCLVKPQQGSPLIEYQRFIRDLPPSRRYLIGVSGGRDSIALLHFLVDLGYNKLVVCHLNHQLRGRESRRDARFVEKIARDLQLDSEIGSTDVGALAKQSKLSIETAARFARFAFFVEAARRRRCSRIFLAHHADDLVETALLNLFRGASPGG